MATTMAGALLGDLRATRLELVKDRCERSFLDFVELMWPVLDPGQPFVRGKVQEAIALHLTAVTEGRIQNLLANVPPGSTKTYLANVLWPAWEWGPRNRPDLRYMAWSYSPELAEKANDDCRRVIRSEVYQRFWGDRFKILKGKSDAKSFYENDKGGWRRSSSIKGAGTGFRADRLIWDDPHSVADADSAAALKVGTRWFARTLPTRVRNAGDDVTVKVPWWVRDIHGDLLDDPDDKRPVTATATIGIMQRVDLHDISGIVLKNPALGYEILLIEMRYRGAKHPARMLPTWQDSTIGYQDWRTEEGDLADPVRYPEAKLARMEAQMLSEGMGNDAIAAQFDQWPTSDSGALFIDATLGPLVEPQDVPSGTDKRGWDFAASEGKRSDWTATARVRRGSDKCFYLMDSEAMRGSPDKVDKFITKYHGLDAKTLQWSIPQDPGQAGKSQVAYIVRELTVGRHVTSSRELGKEKSAKPVSSQAAQGNFKIVRHKGWEIVRSQMIEFPYGDYDDLIDAISRAFAAHVELPPKTENYGGYFETVAANGEAMYSAPVQATLDRDFDF
jgi:predicted phage terminase large subunit-like protein